MEYEESKRALIADLKSMAQTSEINIFWGDRGFTPETLCKEIEDETEIGKKHIEMHIGAMKLIDEIIADEKAKKERRWGWIKKLKFWKL